MMGIFGWLLIAWSVGCFVGGYLDLTVISMLGAMTCFNYADLWELNRQVDELKKGRR